MNWLVSLLLSLLSWSLFAQCPDLSYEKADDFCIAERIEISNTDTTYRWDFCAGDIENGFSSEVLLSNTDFFRNRSIKVIQDNKKWYALCVSQTANNLQLIDLGSDLDNINATYLSYGTFSNSFSGAYDMEMAFDGSIWRGFVANTNNGNIVRLDFNAGIEAAPSLVNLGNFGGNVTSPTHVLVRQDGGNFYGFVSNGDKLVRLNFGTNLGNTSPSVDVLTVTGSSNLRGLDLIKDCDSWVGLALSYSNNGVYSVNFLSGLDSAPSFIQLLPSPTLSFPANVFILNEKANYYAFVQGALGALYRMDFGSSLADFTFSTSAVSDPVFTSNQNFAVDIVNENSKWYGFNFNLDNRQLIQYSFQDVCSSSQPELTDSIPDDVYYSSSGKYYITNQYMDATGGFSYHLDSVSVSVDTAPLIDIDKTASICLTTAIEFSSGLSALSSYSWDFNDDGIEDSDEETPQVLFDTLDGVGTYTVRLDVSDGTCHNFTEQQITIYPEPPVPTFEFEVEAFCTENEVVITNTTDDSTYDGLVDYHWTITDLGDSITQNWTFEFATSGEKIISVYSSIPGCESEVVYDTINIFDAPAVNFEASETCEGDITSFSNSSGGVSFEWDFDDGFFSTSSNPDHLYAEAGTYMVSLTATDENSCPNELIKAVTVKALPDPDFTYSQLCENEAAVFTDLSIVNGGSIVGWEWYVDGEFVSAAQYPEITFGVSGTHEVRLIAYGNNGCDASLTEMVTVAEKEAVNLEFEVGCLSTASIFTDQTTYTSPVASRVWLFDGVLDESATSSTFSKTITTSGSHDVMMIANLENGCSAIGEVEIEIPENPDFSYTTTALCDNEEIIFSDSSISPASNEIISRTWLIDGKNIGNGISALSTVLSADSHELELQVSTTFGCELTFRETFEVAAAPTPTFQVNSDYGVPPFTLVATNTSAGSSGYAWYLDGVFISNQTDLSTVIQSEGQKELKLLATNEAGCVDSTVALINSAAPVMDLQLPQLELTENGNAMEIRVVVANNSNLPVEAIDFEIDLENEFKLGERVFRRINIGQQALIKLTTTIPVSANNIGYLCVTAESVYDVEDASPVDNEACILVTGKKVVVEPPFPNPAAESTSVHVIIPESGRVDVAVLNLAGDELTRKSYQNKAAGLQVFDVALFHMEAGTYIINVSYKGGSKQYKVVKQ